MKGVNSVSSVDLNSFYANERFEFMQWARTNLGLNITLDNVMCLGFQSTKIASSLAVTTNVFYHGTFNANLGATTTFVVHVNGVDIISQDASTNVQYHGRFIFDSLTITGSNDFVYSEFLVFKIIL